MKRAGQLTLQAVCVWVCVQAHACVCVVKASEKEGERIFLVLQFLEQWRQAEIWESISVTHESNSQQDCDLR